MGKGGVVSECLEVDEFDKDVGVLLRIAGLAELPLDVLNLPMDDFLLGGAVLGLANGLDEQPRLLADELRSLVVLEEILHFNLPVGTIINKPPATNHDCWA